MIVDWLIFVVRTVGSLPAVILLVVYLGATMLSIVRGIQI